MYHLKIDDIYSREISNFSYTVFAGNIHDTIFNISLDIKYSFTL